MGAADPFVSQTFILETQGERHLWFTGKNYELWKKKIEAHKEKRMWGENFLPKNLKLFWSLQVTQGIYV